jgi:hypothetical protein
MIIVSNTSPIINLACVGQLNLLQQLYGRITIPKAVYHEITVKGAGQAGSRELPLLERIESHQIIDLLFVASLRMELDEGESEAIALAIQLKADLLLMDERRGRAMTSRFGLKFVGLLGRLVEARQKGSLTFVKPALDDLIVKAGFWISHKLYVGVLQSVGE